MRERLIGAAVLVVIAVILIPWLVSRAHHPEDVVTQTSWPASASTPAQPYVLPLQSTVPASSSAAAMPTPAARTTANAVTPGAKALAASSSPSPHTVVRQKPLPVNSKPVASKVDLAALPKVNSLSAATGWHVQAASFSDIKAAQTLEKHLEQAGFKVSVAPHLVGKTTYYRVLVGPYPNKTQADSAATGVARISRTKVLIRKPGRGKG
ncbi:MAG: SPOR domain-containing protein [Gammaproteobacteria bacterium]